MPHDVAGSKGQAAGVNGAWEISRSGSPFEDWAREHDSLFATGAWAHVLQGLGCQIVYAWQPGLRTGVVVPIFRRGPIRIGFLGFPVAGDAFARLAPEEFEALQRTLADALGCDLVRGVRSQVHAPSPGALPEIWVEDLQAWPGERRKRIAKDLAFAARTGADRCVVTPFVEGDQAHELYCRTVLGHRGRLRYTREYFRRLMELAGSRRLESVATLDANGRATAFAVMARNGDVAYYLHGAVHPDARGSGAGDVLLAHLIEVARMQGARSFSLMASPADQPGLVRYKKKWGESEGWTCTHDVGRGWLGRPAELLLRHAARAAARGAPA